MLMYYWIIDVFDHAHVEMDTGVTWSAQHYTIPVPRTYIETINSFSTSPESPESSNTTQIMWQVDHLKRLANHTVMFAFTKIGTYAVAPPEEMYVLVSHDLLTVTDPAQASWHMWPEVSIYISLHQLAHTLSLCVLVLADQIIMCLCFILDMWEAQTCACASSNLLARILRTASTILPSSQGPFQIARGIF